MTMDIPRIDLDQVEARRLYREYLAHRHFSKPVDDEIRRTYRAIAQGGVVIRALEAICAAGLNGQGLPKLAIVRADAEACFLQMWRDGSARFNSSRFTRRSHTRQYIELPAGSFPGADYRSDQRAIVPLIPVKHRPKKSLGEYHILWEADWQAVPRDPFLLRRLGQSDLWLVVAAWDLTEVEQAALAARVNIA